MTRTVVHLSDLHFGRIDGATLEPLVAAINDVHPHLVAVSGDLTQRARRLEFQQARQFLDRLPGQLIVVPGNHDVPAIGNPYLRFFSDWGRFRKYIHPEIEQSYADKAIAVIGINTARALAWKGGRINARQMETVRQFFEDAARDSGENSGGPPPPGYSASMARQFRDAGPVSPAALGRMRR